MLAHHHKADLSTYSYHYFRMQQTVTTQHIEAETKWSQFYRDNVKIKIMSNLIYSIRTSAISHTTITSAEWNVAEWVTLF